MSANQGIADKQAVDDLEQRRSPEGPAIDSVDCTPRPRYRETPEQFDARMRALRGEQAALRLSVSRDNRNAALRSAPVGSLTVYWTQCACSWRGLQHNDPELARREYDVHACTANDGDAIHRQYRGPIDRRPRSTMVEARGESVDVIESYRLGPNREVIDRKVEVLDDFEQRVKLLETK